MSNPNDSQPFASEEGAFDTGTPGAEAVSVATTKPATSPTLKMVVAGCAVVLLAGIGWFGWSLMSGTPTPQRPPQNVQAPGTAEQKIPTLAELTQGKDPVSPAASEAPSEGPQQNEDPFLLLGNEDAPDVDLVSPAPNETTPQDASVLTNLGNLGSTEGETAPLETPLATDPFAVFQEEESAAAQEVTPSAPTSSLSWKNTMPVLLGAVNSSQLVILDDASGTIGPAQEFIFTVEDPAALEVKSVGSQHVLVKLLAPFEGTQQITVRDPLSGSVGSILVLGAVSSDQPRTFVFESPTVLTLENNATTGMTDLVGTHSPEELGLRAGDIIDTDAFGGARMRLTTYEQVATGWKYSGPRLHVTASRPTQESAPSQNSTLVEPRLVALEQGMHDIKQEVQGIAKALASQGVKSTPAPRKETPRPTQSPASSAPARAADVVRTSKPATAPERPIAASSNKVRVLKPAQTPKPKAPTTASVLTFSSSEALPEISQEDIPAPGACQISALALGRAWLRAPGGSLTEVKEGQRLLDGRLITRITPQEGIKVGTETWGCRWRQGIDL